MVKPKNTEAASPAAITEERRINSEKRTVPAPPILNQDKIKVQINKVPVPVARIFTTRRSSSKKQVVVMSQLQPDLIQATVIKVFRRYDCETIDLEILIYFTMQFFEISVDSYETINKVIRNHIINNFNVEQGRLRVLADVGMRKLVVKCSITK